MMNSRYIMNTYTKVNPNAARSHNNASMLDGANTENAEFKIPNSMIKM